jgi:hypothetical protein
MAKYIYKAFIILHLLSVISFCQGITNIDSPKMLTTKEYLEMRLDILSNSLSNGIIDYPDMGKFGFTIQLQFNDENKISFEVIANIDQNYDNKTKSDIICEAMNIVKVSLKDMLRKYFPELKLDLDKDLIGEWYTSNHQFPFAYWNDGKVKFNK